MSAAVIDQVDAILREWLADPDITIVCGQWHQGSIMELMPEGAARLSAPRYAGEFAGLRDIELDGQPHHLHLDLARLPRVVYVVAPSVCYGFRPSFEIRLCGTADAGDGRFGIALALRRPYPAGRLDRTGVRRYLRRLAGHRRAHPEVVSVRASDSPIPDGAASRRSADWGEIGACIAEEFGLPLGIADAHSFETAVEHIAGTAS